MCLSSPTEAPALHPEAPAKVTTAGSARLFFNLFWFCFLGDVLNFLFCPFMAF